MKTKLFTTTNFFLYCTFIFSLTSCQPEKRDLEPPVIREVDFLPANCDIYYVGDTINVHFNVSDNEELGSFNIEIHNNFDHHTHGTSIVDCDEHEGDEHNHAEGEDHQHEEVEGAWVYQQDYVFMSGALVADVDQQIPVPDSVTPGDYHFMLRLTDRAGWQTIKAVGIELKAIE